MGQVKTETQRSRRERILDSAARLFAEEGFASTNSQRIADDAGVAAGTVYYHFGTKQEILDTLLAERTLAPLVLEVADEAEQRAPRETLHRIGTTMLAGIATRRDIARIVWQETRLHNPERRYLPDLHARMIERVSNALAQASGQSVAAEVVRMRVEAFLSTVLLAALFGAPDDAEDYVAALLDVTWPRSTATVAD